MQMVHCYSTLSDSHTQDSLFQYALSVGGWISTHLGQLDLYIPEDRVAWALLIDPSLQRKPTRDYIL
jgi:hypothetical protein